MAGVRKSMPEMQKFSTFRVLFLAILYFKAGKEARCSFFILQRAHLFICFHRIDGFFAASKKYVDKPRFLCYIIRAVAEWFSRLERRPVTPEVEGSSPFSVATMPLPEGHNIC